MAQRYLLKQKLDCNGNDVPRAPRVVRRSPAVWLVVAVQAPSSHPTSLSQVSHTPQQNTNHDAFDRPNTAAPPGEKKSR